MVEKLNEKKSYKENKPYKKPELKEFGKLMELTKGSNPGPEESGGGLCNSNEQQCTQ